MQNNNKKIYIILIFIIIFLIIFFFIDLFIGSVKIPFTQIIKIIFGQNSEYLEWEVIIKKIRLPRIFTAILVGASLSVSGLLMQTIFRNPLAGPYVLGISSGASLGVAILLLGVGGIFSTYNFNTWNYVW